MTQASSFAKSGGGKGSTKSGPNTAKKEFDKPENWATKMNKGITDTKDLITKGWSVIEKNIKTIDKVGDEIAEMQSTDKVNVTITKVKFASSGDAYNEPRLSTFRKDTAVNPSDAQNVIESSEKELDSIRAVYGVNN